MLDQHISRLKKLNAKQRRDRRALAFAIMTTLCFLLPARICHIYLGEYYKYMLVPLYLLLLMSYRKLLRKFIKEGIWKRLTETQRCIFGEAMKNDGWFESFSKRDPDADELVRIGLFEKPDIAEIDLNGMKQIYYKYQFTQEGRDYLNEHMALRKQFLKAHRRNRFLTLLFLY
ncbi:MAG: hypothetical protein WAO19_04825 [Candidatus Kryptoniota bacterium]